MSDLRPSQWMRSRRLVVAAALALALAIAYQVIGAAVFLPRIADDDPREVVRAYYEARQWGYCSVAERALDAGERQARHAPNCVQPLLPDTLFASDLAISSAADIPLRGQFAEEAQFTVTYTTRWRSETGDAAGSQMRFVYVGRNPGEPWHILSEGTGP